MNRELVLDESTHHREMRLVFFFTSLLILYELFDRYALIEPVPFRWTVIGIIAGVAVGARMSYVVWHILSQRNIGVFKRGAVAVSMPIILGVVGFSSALKTYEAVHFAFYEPESTTIVTKVLSKRLTKIGIFRATILPYAGAREIQVNVVGDLYSQLSPWRRRGRDCLVLTSQIGRDGVKRIVAPNFFDDYIGWSSWSECYNKARINLLIRYWPK